VSGRGVGKWTWCGGEARWGAEGGRGEVYMRGGKAREGSDCPERDELFLRDSFLSRGGASEEISYIEGTSRSRAFYPSELGGGGEGKKTL